MNSLKLITRVLAGAMLAFLAIFVATSVSASAKPNLQQQDPKKKNPPPAPPPRNQAPPPQRQAPPPQRQAPPPQRQAPPPQRSAPPPQQTAPPPQRSAPPPQQTAPPPKQQNLPLQQGPPNNPGTRNNGNPTNQQGSNPPNSAGQRGGGTKTPPNTGGNPPNNAGGNPPNNPGTRGSGNPQTGANPQNNPGQRSGGNPPNQQGGQRGGPPPNQQGGNPPNQQGGQRGGPPPNQQGGNPPNQQGGQRGGNPQNNAGQRGGGNPQNGQRGGGNFPGGPRGGMNPQATHTVTTQNGAVATIRPNGAIVHVEHQGTVIDHGPRGERHIEAPLQGGGRVVVEGNHRGFVEHSFQRDNRNFVSRTIVVNNRSEVRVYEHERFRGIDYDRYVPAFYYRPAFYGWFFSPWQGGISFQWGWGAWFGFYRGYFEPYPVYTAPNYWLTDYLISENLRIAYENQQLDAANQNSYNNPAPDQGYQSAPVTLSPEVKQAIADEVARQLAQAQAEAQQGGSEQALPPTDSNGDVIPPALDPQMSTFIVSSNLQVYDGDVACALTPGDVIVRIDDTPGDDGAVEVKVTNTKAGDCRGGARPRVYVTDLQEMLNHFRAQIDTGMQQLAAKQGTNGIPRAPAGSTSTIQGPGQAPPDPNAANILQQQQRNADAIENQVRQQSGRGGNQN
jgi:hypothetical protein